jgi:excisionase family DNA binding protein
MDDLLTVAEIATVLKLNQQTVRNWIDAGRLPAMRIGRAVCVRRADFDRFLDQAYTRNRKAAEPPGPTIWDGHVPAPVLPDAPNQSDRVGSQRFRPCLSAQFQMGTRTICPGNSAS